MSASAGILRAAWGRSRFFRELDHFKRHTALALADDLQLHLDRAQNFTSLCCDRIALRRQHLIVLDLVQRFPQLLFEIYRR